MTNFKLLFFIHYFMQVNGTFQTAPRTIVYNSIPIIFYKKFTDKSVVEKLILYKQHILAAKL